MSCIYKGSVIDTNISKNARGGTEMMRDRLLKSVPQDLLQKYAIHLSRPRKVYTDVQNILWAHDLAEDPENHILLNEGWKKFDKFVFVSYWQRDQYIRTYGIPHSYCSVIENAIELKYENYKKTNDQIRFIYHTTPHRGLELLYPVFNELSKTYDNIHLDVFSSFEVYGWKERDIPYERLFEDLELHPKITYHGSKPNDVIIDHLKHSHIFAYPCIWQETSCIAMIEAITAGCLVVHPSLAALPETSHNSTIMYDYSENIHQHVGTIYSILNNLMEKENHNPGSIELYGAARARYFSQFSSKHSIELFGMNWRNLLANLKSN